MDPDSGWMNEFEPALQAAQAKGKAVLLVFYKEDCAGCRKMEAGTYTNAEVQRELLEWFVPVHLDILKQREVRTRYAAYWTPSFFFLDPHGRMYESFNGCLGAEDFRILLRLGKAAIDLPRGRYLKVIDLMDSGLRLFPSNPRAASMLFTRGMAEYLLAKEKSSFRGAMTEIVEEYPASPEARMWPWSDRP